MALLNCSEINVSRIFSKRDRCFMICSNYIRSLLRKWGLPILELYESYRGIITRISW